MVGLHVLLEVENKLEYLLRCCRDINRRGRGQCHFAIVVGVDGSTELNHHQQVSWQNGKRTYLPRCCVQGLSGVEQGNDAWMDHSEMTSRASLDEETEQLIRVLYPSLRRFAAVAGASESDPDDLVQEALLRSIRTRSLAEIEFPEAYLRRAILNVASNERRSTRRRTARLRQVSSGVDGLSNDNYPSDLADLFQLSSVARAVLFMAEVEKATHREIAGTLGISESNSRMVAARARAALRSNLKEETS